MGGVRYKDLYPGIDLEVTGEGGRLVQRVVSRGGDLGAVRLRVEGADKLAVAGDSLQVTTAEGSFTIPLLQLAEVGSSNPVLPSGKPQVNGREVAAPFATGSGPQARTTASAPSDLSYATFLGGGGEDGALAIAVDGSGAAYVTGYTISSDFPTTPGAYDTSFNGENDAFVAKLNPAGSALVYATFLGGSSSAKASAIAVDSIGAAYIAGSTWSYDFPTTPGAYDTSFNGRSDAFVAKLNPAGSALSYSTFLGGEDLDYARGIAVDGSGAAYVTGDSASSAFATTPGAFDTSFNGVNAAFVAKLNPAGSAVTYATFLGGSGFDWAYGIAVDGSGAAYVAGGTQSPDFPTTPGAYDTSFNGRSDAFMAKLGPGVGVPPPVAVQPLEPYGFASFPISWTAGATWAGTAAASYDVQYRDGASGDWTDLLASTTSTSTTFSGQESHTYYFRARSRTATGALGDWGEPVYTIVDLTPPTGSVSINGGALYATSITATLSISATDAASGVGQMAFSNDGASWSSWEPYAASKAWTLTAGEGLKTVYTRFRDKAGNLSAIYSDTITLISAPTTGPVVIVINGGDLYTRVPTVTLTLSPPGGAGELSSIGV